VKRISGFVFAAAILIAATAIGDSTALAAGPSPATPQKAAPPKEQDAAFGKKLVAAARKQTWIPVIYNPAYTKISYPGGDVPWYFGVCTDVVVRAYRDFGIDLQELVKKSGVGSGDTNIDHRRVDVQRKFFARYGQSLPVSANGADYHPGDIVSFHVPEGRFSKTHVAIVSDRTSSKGVPLIIHNRGWSVQEEDWLFSPDARITGHYRYAGPGGAKVAAGR